jgi:transposase InsO family protein
MSLRQEFVLLARQDGANRRELCRRFGISPQTAYKWLARYQQHGPCGLADRARRPHHCPAQTSPTLEQHVVALRQQHPAWGGRKISRRLSDLGYTSIPAPSTVTSILHRHGLISPEASAKSVAWQRFEHLEPNHLWQMDYKGWFVMRDGRRCSPLTVLDDHSRFNIVLAACQATDGAIVQWHLREAFRRYGLPLRINTDNGAPWGCPIQPGQLTRLQVWLIRLGIHLSHSRPAHPQTNGKEERFHRTLKAEVLNGHHFASCRDAQHAFDAWRVVYNQQRPHEAIGLATPITRYRPSARPYPERLPPIEYGPADTVVTVKWNGELHFQGRRFKVSSALHRLPIALRPDPDNANRYALYFAHHRFGLIDMTAPDAH